MGCKGLHCDGCNHGSRGPAAAVIALLVIIAVGLRAAWPKVVHGAEIAGWAVAGVSAAALITAGAVLTVRVTRRARARRAARQVTYHAEAFIPAGRVIEPTAIRQPDRPALGPVPPSRPGLWLSRPEESRAPRRR